MLAKATVAAIWLFLPLLVFHAEGAIDTYTYDSLGRLIKADFGAAGTIVYTYDMAGHIISRSLGASRDLNGDGVVNVADVQMIINEALGVARASHDLNHDGVVSVADIQLVGNAALGFN